MPAGTGVHCVAPTAAYVPAAHAVDETASHQWPAAHTWQRPSPRRANVPATAHGSGGEAGSAHDAPAGQKKHAVALPSE